jgi:hypothetical protein
MLIKALIRYIKKPFRFMYYRPKAKFTNLTTTKYTNFYRPSSYPYLTGDTLRKFSDYKYDETSRKTDLKIKTGEVVFVKIEYLREFLLHVNRNNLNTRYTIVAHNSDAEVNLSLLNDLNYSNVQIWTQNLNTNEIDNLHFLPIGFENKRYLKNGLIRNLNKYNDNKKNKKYLVSSNFNSNTNLDIRYPVEKLFNTIDYVDNQKFTSKEFLKNLSYYKFSICPPGNGVDTHRIWESLFVNTVPVIIKNNFSTNMNKNSIPCLILNKWEEFLNIEEITLSRMYKEYLKNFNFKTFTSFEYWWQRIKYESI